MILADTSVWIDHLHAADARLRAALARDDVGCHPFVIEELALGSLRRRSDVLSLLENLREFPVTSHAEMLTLVERARLWGRGLSAVDVHLLGSVAVVPGARLWTRDKRLRAACRDVDVDQVEEP